MPHYLICSDPLTETEMPTEKGSKAVQKQANRRKVKRLTQYRFHPSSALAIHKSRKASG